jgi:pimeloyl-ACP methyl ester carboxylesterase
MVKLSDIKGINRLVTDSVSGITDIVSSIHKTIDPTPGLFGATTSGPIGVINDIVYQSIHNVNHVVRDCIDSIIDQLAPMFDDTQTFQERDLVLSVLNGILGDYLVDHDNPLAIPMTIQEYKKPPLNPSQIHLTDFNGKLLIMVHGLCMNYQQWLFNNHDHGAALAKDFGYTPLYLNYNTGCHVSTNGQLFSDLLETFIHKLNIKDFVIVAHSMGGLVTRSACYYAQSANFSWPDKLNTIFFLGTPHHGAPLEKGGNWVNIILEQFSYAAPFARLAKIRSAGITDLRYGTIRDDDWETTDRFDNVPDERKPVPLLKNVKNYAIAGTLADVSGNIKDRTIGDGLVPTDSALGIHTNPQHCLKFPESSKWIGYGLNHWDLLSHARVYEKIHQWCSAIQ